MKKHAFNQVEVLMMGRTHGDGDRMWERFTEVVKELGFSVRTTGGNFLTHEITCDSSDFITVLELTKYN